MSTDTYTANVKSFISRQGKTRLGIVFAVSLLCLFLLSKCSGSQMGPNSDDISMAIENEIYAHLKVNNNASYVQIKKIKILATENVGNSVDEIIEGRFTSRIKLQKPLYEQVEILSDKEVLDKDYTAIRRLTKSGKTSDLNGKYKATLTSSNGKRKTWNTKLYFDADLKTNLSGFPIERFSSHVMEGSKEYKRLKSTISSAAEKRRIARENFEAKKSTFLKSLEGHWVSEGPLLKSNGKPYYEPEKKPHWDITKPYVELFCDKAFGAGMTFDIPLMTKKSQKIIGKTYWIHDESRSEKVTGTITVNDTYDGFTFLKDEYTGAVTCPAGRRKITMFPLGRPMFSGHISSDLMELNETSYGKTNITMKKTQKAK